MGLMHKATGKLKKCWGTCACICCLLTFCTGGSNSKYRLEWKDEDNYRQKQGKTPQTRFFPTSAYNYIYMIQNPGKALNPKLPPDMKQFGGGRAYLLMMTKLMTAVLGLFLALAALGADGDFAWLTYIFALGNLATNLKKMALAYMFQLQCYNYFLVLSCWYCSCFCATEGCSEMVKIPRHHMWHCSCCCIPCPDGLPCPKMSMFRIFQFHWSDPSIAQTCKFMCTFSRQ